MKTCLYCGGKNKDSDTICLLCKRDLRTGDIPEENKNSLRPFASIPLPQPESPYVSLLLLLPALVLFLFSAAVENAASQTLFFGVHLPRFTHYDMIGDILLLGALAFLGIGVWRMVRQFRVMKGYYLVLQSDTDDESQAPVRAYARYQRKACGFYPILWLLPVAAFLGMIQLLYISSYARSVLLFDSIRVRLPDVQDPIPYIFLGFLAILGVAIQLIVSLKTMVAHRIYRRDCKQMAQGAGASGEFSRLNPRLFPAPSSPKLNLLILPAVLSLAFFGIAFMVGDTLGAPNLAAPAFWSLAMLAGAVVLAIIMVKRYIRHREAVSGYWMATGSDQVSVSDEAKSYQAGRFHVYQASTCGFRCFSWLVPIAFFLLFAIYVLVSNVVYSVVLPGGFRLILPYFEEPALFILLAAVSLICLIILFVVSLNTTLNYRRCANVARTQYQEELAEARARAQAEAEAEAARALAAQEAEEEESSDEGSSLWGESFFTDNAASGETASDATPAAVESAPEETVDLSLWMSGNDKVAAPAEGVDDRRLVALRALSSVKADTSVSSRRVSSWQELYEWFTEFAAAQGFRPEPASIRSLLAAMATGRILYIRAEDEASQAFAATLARFFGTNATVGDVTADWSTPQALLCTDKENVWTDSDCLRGMYYARKTPDAFCTLTLTHGEAADADVYLADLLAYAETPARTHSLCLMREIKDALPEGVAYRAAAKGRPGGVYMDLPANVWCLVLPSEGTALRDSVAGAENGLALTVSLRGVACEPAASEANDEGNLSVSAFLSLLRGLMDEHFLPEEQWKKFDRVEEFLLARTGMRLGNCLARRMETFSSVYMAMEEDLNRVLDALLEAVFMPLIARVDASCLQSDESGVGIYETVSLAFGEDTVPVSMQALRSMGYGA